MSKPFDLQGFYVIDDTGTILSGSSCALVPADIVDRLVDELSDSEIADLRLYGRNVLADAQALDSIAAHLSGRGWGTDDLAFVYQVVLSTGRVIEDIMSSPSWIHVDIDSYLQECPPWDQEIDPASLPAIAKEVASRFDSTDIYDQLDKLACAVLREREAQATDTANP